ncbi:MAG: TIGR04222 domain-containing membrane protein [Acidobacteria bacterium]|nr:TIGR04222 domain-containing membrane protein [Acidobacteriota bacterium]
MEWLTNNPIANLHGFEFLGFYLCFAVLTVVTCWLLIKNTDQSNSLPPLEIPQIPDPYEIAYLRGKENEVIRLAIFSLIDKGYLKLGTDYIEKREGHPDPSLLPNLEKSLFGWISQQSTTVTENSVTKTISGVKPYELFSIKNGMPSRAKVYCESYQNLLEKKRLVTSEKVKEVAWKVGTSGVLILMGLTGYKIAIAYSQGRHNVGFLIALTIFSIIALIIASVPSRLSRRGKLYLKELQQAFANIAKTDKMNVSSPNYDSQVPTLAMAIFGVGILAGTSFSLFEQIFHRSTSNSSYAGSYYGSGCGSSSCGSGSSCSGGGGCGGGGCGGGGCGG